MQDVTLSNFETEVIAASQQTPVLVDFWAPWSEPCKVLVPLLEKIEAEYKGRFKLVKVDADQEQQLAAAFGVRGIPTVVLVVKGQPVDGFADALPEAQIKTFLDKHVPAAEPSDDEPDPEQELAELAQADPQAALVALQEAQQAKPDSADACFNYALALLKLGQVAQAKAVFAPLAGQAVVEPKLAAIQLWLQALEQTQAASANALSELDAKIAANKRDFAARHERALLLLGQSEFTQALDELLEILMRDKAWNEELARKSYISILNLIEPPKVKVAEGQVPPEDPRFAAYRRRLSSVILS